MSRATVIITETRPTTDVEFSHVYAYQSTDPACAEFNTCAEQVGMVETIHATGPFVIDPTFVADLPNNEKTSNYYVKWGLENGPSSLDSLTRSQQYIVSDTSQVSGWPSDNNPTTVVQLWRQSKTAIAANTALDSTGMYNKLWTWAETVHNPAHSITVTANVTVG